MAPRALIHYLGEAAGDPLGLPLPPSVRRTCTPSTASLLNQTELRAADILFLVAAPAAADRAIELLVEIRRRGHFPVIVVMLEFRAEWAVDAFRAGATDVISSSASAAEFLQVLARAGITPGPAAAEASSGPCLVGKSAAITGIVRYATQIAAGDGTVLITGETGTGKEITAEMIHARSRRAGGPMIAVNCAALPETLLESELFGHLKGAFTGAHRSRAGAFAAADGGTIFLDEIGELNSAIQAKLLRVIENRTVRPLGSDREAPVDVRVIAATNQEPDRLLRERRFRQDLYFRLDVSRIHIPPLRARREDIPPLVDHLMARCADRHGVPATRLDARLLDRLVHYDWPGNVRELRNLVDAILSAQPGAIARIEDLPLHWRDRLRTVTNRGDLERSRVLEALVSANWNKTEAARRLSCSRMTLYRKMSRHRIERAGAA